jgi:sialate O-acetylesterase
MVVTIDVGEANDIHPKDKRPVAKRLAAWALSTVYGQPGAFSGPLMRKASPNAGRIVVEFDHTDGGLVAKGGELKGFSIAGNDRQWKPAQAEIVGETVVVSSPGVPEPAAVRYAWADNPECNLYNGADFPASPFRSDKWEIK